jgi:hypothetical protein
MSTSSENQHTLPSYTPNENNDRPVKSAPLPPIYVRQKNDTNDSPQSLLYQQIRNELEEKYGEILFELAQRVVALEYKQNRKSWFC